MKAAPAAVPGLAALLRRSGATVECDVEGGSMGAGVPHGATVRIRCDGMASASEGSVVAVMIAGTLSVHRVVHRGRSRRGRGWVVTHGDGNLTCDAPMPESCVVGLVDAVRHVGDGAWRPVGAPPIVTSRRAAFTRAERALVCALLEVSPRAARATKGLVMMAMAPLVWLRPYPEGRVRSASIAHRSPP